MDESIQVLHVDDDPDFGDLVATFLETENDHISVATATRAREARERLAVEEVDCVVSDYDMPETDGIELLQAVREDYPDLPFVLFTGKGSEEVASEAISAGVSDYLQKGGGTQQFTVLANRIENLVEQHRAKRRLDRHLERQRESERDFQDLRAVVCDAGTSPTEKRRRLLELGRARLGMENGHLVRIDEERGCHQVLTARGSDIVREGITDLSETYCRQTIASEEILDVYDAPNAGWDGDPAYERFGIGSYIGRKLSVDGTLYGTLCYVSEAPRESPFTHEEKAFFDLCCQWFTHLLERTRRRARAEALFDTATDAIFVVDVGPEGDLRIRRVNRSYEELTGLSADQVRGGCPSAVVESDEGRAIEDRYRECVERREPVAFTATRTHEGVTRDWRTRLAPVVEYDEVVQVIGVTRPVDDAESRAHPLL